MDKPINKTINIVLSRGKGIPCLWERGGGYSNTGESQLIGDGFGRPKTPIYIKRKGELSCGDHALIPILRNDLVINASHHREDFEIEINRIVKIDTKEQNAELQTVATFSENEWDSSIPDCMAEMINVIKKKATTYHCRSAMFLREG